MKTKHTPGKWHARIYNSESRGEYCAVVKDTSEMSCQIIADIAKCHERDANACLVSAAPDLLEALVNMLEVAETVSEFYGNKLNILNMAKQAIKKARGA